MNRFIIFKLLKCYKSCCIPALGTGLLFLVWVSLSYAQTKPSFVPPDWASIMKLYKQEAWKHLIPQLEFVVSLPLEDQEYLKRARFILGQSYLALKEYDLAQKSFQAGQEMDHAHSDLWVYHRMRAYLHANQQPEAIPLMKTLLQAPSNPFYLKKIKANIKNYYQTEQSTTLIYPLLQTALTQYPKLLQDHQIVEIFAKSAVILNQPLPTEAYRLQWLHPEGLKTAQQSDTQRSQLKLTSADYLNRFKKLRKLKLYHYLTKTIPQQIDAIPDFKIRTQIANIYLRALFQKKQYRTILELQKKGILTQKYKAYLTSQLFWSMRSYQRLRQLKSARQMLKDLEKANPGSTWLPSAYQKMAETYEVIDDEKSADFWWKKLVSMFPGTKEAEVAYWKLAWYRYRNQRYKDALHYVHQAQNNQVLSAEVLAKFLYWQGKLEHFSGEKEQAAETFKKLQQNWPNTYYNFRFLSRPGKWISEVATYGIAPSHQGVRIPAPPQGELAQLVKRHEFLFMVGENEHAVFEVKRDISRHSKYSMVWRGSELLYKNEEYHPLQTFISDYYLGDLKKLSIAHPLWKFAYPRPYWDFIQEQSQKAKIDPYWVLAIIREESRYDVDALSIANAHGLMQLIVPTAKAVAKQQKMRLTNLNNLYNPHFNIRLGTHYLGSLAKQFKNQMVYASGSYNAGPHRMKKWLKTHGNLPIDEFVESIPFRETRNYVKRVFMSYTLYKMVYQEH